MSLFGRSGILQGSQQSLSAFSTDSFEVSSVNKLLTFNDNVQTGNNIELLDTTTIGCNMSGLYFSTFIGYPAATAANNRLLDLIVGLNGVSRSSIGNIQVNASNSQFGSLATLFELKAGDVLQMSVVSSATWDFLAETGYGSSFFTGAADRPAYFWNFVRQG